MKYMKLKPIKYCKCGKYEPKSTKGLIDLKCKNCGGRKKPKLLK